jgi:hypothetical protein
LTPLDPSSGTAGDGVIALTQVRGVNEQRSGALS